MAYVARAKRLKMLFLIAAFCMSGALGCSALSSSDDNGGNNLGNGHHGSDGDLDGDGVGEREPPEAEPVVWNDDSIGSWVGSEFCANGVVMLHDDFEDGNITALPEWSVDLKVEENPLGEEDLSVPMVIIEGSEGKYLSGVQDDLRAAHPDLAPWPFPARLYLHFDQDSNGFSMRSRLTAPEDVNLIWVNDDEDPTGARKPAVRLFHEMVEEGEGQYSERVYILDMAGVELCAIGGFGPGWRRIDLYYNAIAGEWRLDVDYKTACEDVFFQEAAETTLQYLFIGRRAHVDDVKYGIGCAPPPVGQPCGDERDCGLVGDICGRDGICHRPRDVQCEIDSDCRDATTCHGVWDGHDLLGEGSCSAPCLRHGDCRPMELCLPASAEEGSCRSMCSYDGSCPDGRSCVEVAGVRACLADNCKNNGHWSRRSDGLLECDCGEGFVQNPDTMRCEDIGDCVTSDDCDSGQVCGGGACHINRDRACHDFTDPDACPYGMSCYGYSLNGVLTGTGICRENCFSDADCMPYETCVPATLIDWACLQRCESDADCSEGLICLPGYGGAFCMPEKCQLYGIWTWDYYDQAYLCRCMEGYTPDPYSGRCIE